MPTRRATLGRRGEDIARRWLEQRGLVFVQSNFRTRYGELDLVMRDGLATVFVEIKTRRNRRFGQPEESISDRKMERLRAAAEAYQSRHPDVIELRLDVVILEQHEGTWFVRHLRAVG